MTTYAPPSQASGQQLPPPLPPTPVSYADPNRGSSGALLGACAALLVCSAAAVVSAVMLIRPVPAAVHTVVVPPAPPTYTAAEVSAAKQQACAAWLTASTAMAQASNAAADAPKGWDDPIKQDALGNEARVALTQSAYLQTRVGPATPPEVAGPINDYVVATLDQEEATMRRMGSLVDAAIDRANAATDKVNAACGMR